VPSIVFLLRYATFDIILEHEFCLNDDCKCYVILSLETHKLFIKAL